MKILFAASEATPFAKTGGLADVAGSLPLALAARGHDVRVVIPRYAAVNMEKFGLRHCAEFFVPSGKWNERCDVLEGETGSVTFYFIEKDRYFDRPFFYGTSSGDYPDNAERFLFFSRAVFELCRNLNFIPDIIHSNDWQTGFIPLYLEKLYRSSGFSETRSVFTIHNLGYQGIFWHWDMKLTGLGWDIFTPEGIEFWGKINFMKAGIISADIITTVSKTYSREIMSPEFGHGLDGVLAKRAANIHGILNGIDYDMWNPARNPDIPGRYTAEHPAGKAACRSSLLDMLGLPSTKGPVVGMVTRLASQKGLDIVTAGLPSLLSTNATLVILGTGDETYERQLTKLAELHPGRIKAELQYDENLAKAIYAGSDIFLMPSLYEPCGLSQMIALRYGTVPVVRRTGGLADTVQDYDPKTGIGSGFVFDDYSTTALVTALKRAFTLFHDKEKWLQLVQSCMKEDFSWKRSAQEYEAIYRKTFVKV